MLVPGMHVSTVYFHKNNIDCLSLSKMWLVIFSGIHYCKVSQIGAGTTISGALIHIRSSQSQSPAAKAKSMAYQNA